MERYRESSKCPKCGGAFARARYRSGDRARPFAGKATEVIERKCVRCGYEWDEAPLDAASQEVKA